MAILWPLYKQWRPGWWKWFDKLVEKLWIIIGIFRHLFLKTDLLCMDKMEVGRSLHLLAFHAGENVGSHKRPLQCTLVYNITEDILWRLAMVLNTARSR